MVRVCCNFRRVFMTKGDKLGIVILIAVVAFEAWLFTNGLEAAAALTALVLAALAGFWLVLWIFYKIACMTEAAIKSVVSRWGW